MSKHTKLPWDNKDLPDIAERYGNEAGLTIYASDDLGVASCTNSARDTETNRTNAALIVKAVNNFSEMEEALRGFVDDFENKTMIATLTDHFITAKSILAKLDGEEPEIWSTCKCGSEKEGGPSPPEVCPDCGRMNCYMLEETPHANDK